MQLDSKLYNESLVILDIMEYRENYHSLPNIILILKTKALLQFELRTALDNELSDILLYELIE
jgi:hypothetical protein